MPATTIEAPEAGATATPEARNPFPPSSQTAIDAALATLQSRAAAWAAMPLAERRRLLDGTRRGMIAVAERWVEASCRAKGIGFDEPRAGEEWLGGPYTVLRNVRLLLRSLDEIARDGRPRIAGGLRGRADGQVVARAFPADVWDGAFFPGVRAEVWMEPGMTETEVLDRQARLYRQPRDGGVVGLVLGGGNVSSIGPMDVLYKLFVEHQVVLYKVHPVNAYLGSLFEEAFRPLVEGGFLRLVYGGADTGAYLCEHDDVDEIHITGSDKTVEAIVFGPGEEGQRRKARKQPRNDKPISSELGNVSPVIVVPAMWSEAELRYQAENVASMLANNAGFNCNAARVIVTAAWWPQREEFLDRIEACLAALPARKAYYPGAADRHQAMVSAHPEAHRVGGSGPGELPWTLIRGLDPTRRDDPCFRIEAFCSLFAEVALPEEGITDWMRRAVDFCNNTLWGTLNATLLVHPSLENDPLASAAIDSAVEDLRYGAILFNHWAGVAYGLCVTPWGAFPGHPLHDIQSGSGVVHNTAMLDGVQKTVVRAPFRAFPRPPWFVRHRTAHRVGRAMAFFEGSPSVTRLPRLLAAALTG